MKRLSEMLIMLLCTLALLVSLPGCGQTDDRTDEDAANAAEAGAEDTSAALSGKTGDSRFTLRYSASDSLNPLTGDNVYNEVLMSLMYEGLFRLDANFQPVPVLCESYETDDGLTFTFSLIEAKMHDGSSLTASDVVYSIDEAMESSKYSRRLSGIVSCYAEDSSHVVIELGSVNYNLPALLDVPIVCYGTGYNTVPDGTGPYQFKQIGSLCTLSAFSDYRDASAITEKTLYLQEFEDDTVEDSFSGDSLDLIWDNPNDDSELHLYGEYESRCYDTSILQYIGFNYNRSYLCDTNIRKAISCAVDRTLIVDTIYGGFGRGAVLLYNPAYYLYKDSWGSAESFSIAAMSSYIAAAGLEDNNNDGYLEYSYDGWWDSLSMRFLVCSDSSKKVEAANAIAENLQRIGLDVTVTALSWEEYLAALENGEYELYYGEAALTHDFDFSSLLSYGGSMHYGGVGSENYDELLAAVREADNEVALRVAAGALCEYAAEDVPLIPVMYRQYVVYSHRGELIGVEPSVSGVFQQADEWSIQLS